LIKILIVLILLISLNLDMCLMIGFIDWSDQNDDLPKKIMNVFEKVFINIVCEKIF
jgi:hypothetical protein